MYALIIVIAVLSPAGGAVTPVGVTSQVAQMSVSDPKRTQQVDCHVPPVSIFAFDLGQSAFEFVGPKYSKR
jgi:hypothetical protein